MKMELSEKEEKSTRPKLVESFLQTLSSFFKREPKTPKVEPPLNLIPQTIEELYKEQEEKYRQQMERSRDIVKSIQKINMQTIPGTKYEYEKIADLGKGAFGQVYQVSFPDYKKLGLENKNYALKIIRYNPEKDKDYFIQKNMNEKYIMDRIQKETGCLPEFLCYYFPDDEPIIDSKNNIWYISELMDGDLQKLAKALDVEERVDFVNEHLFPTVKTGIQKLHNIGIVHADIKPENILYREENEENITVKIGDLGSSCTLLFDDYGKSTDPKCENCKICQNRFKGTLPYVEPSIFEQYIIQVYDKKYNQPTIWKKETDDYALAITMINFLVGRNMVSSAALQKLLSFAANKQDTPESLIEKYKDYLRNQFQLIVDSKEKLLNFGLKPEIFKFIVDHTIKYV